MLGAVEYDELHQLYLLCDVFVCPSYSESFGHPLVEAVASGPPVVAANLPVHREICEDDLKDFNDLNEVDIATECVRVLTDQSLREELGKTGLQRSQQFSWDEHVRQLEALIHRVAGNSK